MKLISNWIPSLKQKRTGNAILSASAIALLSLTASSCRDFSTNMGNSGGVFGNDGHAMVTCAASSTSASKDSMLKLLNPDMGGEELAQSFVPQATVKNVGGVTLALQLFKTDFSTPTGNLTVMLVSEKNHQPDLLDPQGLIASVPVSSIPTSAKAVTFAFGSPIPQLNANTTYWIVLNANGLNWNPNSYIGWLGTDYDAYPNGQALAHDKSGGWINPDQTPTSTVNKRDLAFQLGCL